MAYDKRDPYELRDAIAKLALALPGVFESEQWSGWAFKVPDPQRGVAKPKLLTYVLDGKNHGWHARFKLPGTAEAGRAAEVVARLAWVEPDPWKTLGPAGWVVARPRTDAQLRILAGLLAESRALLPDPDPVPPSVEEDTVGEPAAMLPRQLPARIDWVMQSARDGGWAFADPDAAAFDG